MTPARLVLELAAFAAVVPIVAHGVSNTVAFLLGRYPGMA